MYYDGGSHYNYCKSLAGAPQSSIKQIEDDSGNLANPDTSTDDFKSQFMQSLDSGTKVDAKSQYNVDIQAEKVSSDPIKTFTWILAQ